jgi:hypothetical protein
MSDLTHLPPATPDEIRKMAAAAGLTLPEALLQQLIEAWPIFEAMVRRLPRGRARMDEPAHSYSPARIVEPRG